MAPRLEDTKACGHDLQRLCDDLTLHEGAVQYALSVLWGEERDDKIAHQFADWYVSQETFTRICVGWNYWWMEVAA